MPIWIRPWPTRGYVTRDEDDCRLRRIMLALVRSPRSTTAAGVLSLNYYDDVAGAWGTLMRSRDEYSALFASLGQPEYCR